jgi:hypothetical protein
VTCPAGDSSVIPSIVNDAEDLTNFIRFVDGGLYADFEAPAAVSEAFSAAESKGRFFGERVRSADAFRQVREIRRPTD